MTTSQLMNTSSKTDQLNRPTPAVSIIINTDGRAKSLTATLQSLRQLDYPNFEVCVVYGPTPDGTKELLDTWNDIKVAHCPTRNLSQSRNIALALAAGEIIAFLDDDSIPEPEWLTKVIAPFENPIVGACGGFLLDHTGVSYQWRFGTASRMGIADTSWQRPTPEYNFPYTANFPHVMANSAFRLDAVLSVGGFDEQFIYFLDETDLICRLVDAGFHIIQLEGAPVHHKYAPSHIRTEGRFLTSWYTILRSKIYFSIVNACGHHDVAAAIKDAHAFADELRKGLEWGISIGKLSDDLRERLDDDFRNALNSGLKEGLNKNRLFYNESALSQYNTEFKHFPTQESNGHRKTICFLTQTYPPASIGGIGRFVHQLARAIAELGHQVHVLTKAVEQDSVDLEDGVWVHRISPKSHSLAAEARAAKVPQHIWNYSATMLEVAKGIAVERPIDAVIAPIWDCEGISFLMDGSWPLITSLQTTLYFYLESHPHVKEDKVFMSSFAEPMMALEKELFNKSSGIFGISDAIVTEIKHAYDVTFEDYPISVIPLGQEDWSCFPVKRPDDLPADTLRLLFVGRLEERKGIDVLLDVLPDLLSRHSKLHVDIVGNDNLPSASGPTYRQLFEKKYEGESFLQRVSFRGEVPESELLGFYKSCDLFVAPSRFESFGLILLEAMIFGKPVVAARAGGMVEVVEEGISGLIAEPGDPVSLATAIETLLGDPALRRRMGQAGRTRYEARFTEKHMARGVLDFVTAIAERAKIQQRRPH